MLFAFCFLLSAFRFWLCTFRFRFLLVAFCLLLPVCCFLHFALSFLLLAFLLSAFNFLFLASCDPKCSQLSAFSFLLLVDCTQLPNSYYLRLLFFASCFCLSAYHLPFSIVCHYVSCFSLTFIISISCQQLPCFHHFQRCHDCSSTSFLKDHSHTLFLQVVLSSLLLWFS